MDVVCTSDVDEVEYTRFLDGFAGTPGTVLGYHYPFYLRFLADVAYPGASLRFVQARDARGELVGVMPALHLVTPAVNAWLSLAYFGPNAGALVRDQSPADGSRVTTALARAACADARDRGCASMTVYTPLGHGSADYLAAFGGAEFDIARVSQAQPIPGSADAPSWPRKVRYDVRRAAALGIVVREMANEAELDTVWDIYRRGCDEAGIPLKPRDHVRRLFQSAGSNGIFLVAEHDGEIVGGLIVFAGGGVLSYYLPCARPDKRPLQPGLALLDRAVALGQARGCRLLNLESSPGVDSSVYKFKARCGAEPIEYRVIVKLLRRDALDVYRALGPSGLAAEAPHAFVIPFAALAS